MIKLISGEFYKFWQYAASHELCHFLKPTSPVALSLCSSLIDRHPDLCWIPRKFLVLDTWTYLFPTGYPHLQITTWQAPFFPVRFVIKCCVLTMHFPILCLLYTQFFSIPCSLSSFMSVRVFFRIYFVLIFHVFYFCTYFVSVVSKLLIWRWCVCLSSMTAPSEWFLADGREVLSSV